MKRLLPPILVILIIALAAALYSFNQYWTHRYDTLIKRHAEIYRLDPDLVWSIIYQETYFRPWKVGDAGEIGLMQVKPNVGREWASETGMRDLEKEMTSNPEHVLRDPEKNIQIACWYLEKLYKQYQDVPEYEARMIAAYNAGPSRANEWNRVATGARPLSTEEFVARIDIPSTRGYVKAILSRYKRLKAERGSGIGAVTSLIRPPATQPPARFHLPWDARATCMLMAMPPPDFSCL